MSTTTRILRTRIAVFFILISALLSAESSVGLIDAIGKPAVMPRVEPLFPRALTMSAAHDLASGATGDVASVPTYREYLREQRSSPLLQSVLLNNDVFALYGKPGSKAMGILGQYSLTDIEPVMNEFVRLYDGANGDRGIQPAFYIIYGTCWPGGDIGILSDTIVRQYIEFAADRGWDVYLDHQIGKYTVESAVKKLLPWLDYPNVHLALDPEWRTTKPMQEIGSVTAAEVNTAQKMIQDYMMEHSIPGRRMLVIHQFKPKMILNRDDVRSDFALVQLIHCADGFGSPILKKSTYAQNALAANIPLKSFKLFLKPMVEGAGYDVPIMSPADVFQLNPRPYLIMYQ
jgi:hypothetical protein